MPERDSLDRQQEPANGKPLPTRGHHHHHGDRHHHDHGTEHHHHGPGDNDIIIHDHDDPSGEHDHLIGLVNHVSDVDEYGPADHDHTGNTDRPARDRRLWIDTDWVGWAAANDARRSAGE